MAEIKRSPFASRGMVLFKVAPGGLLHLLGLVGFWPSDRYARYAHAENINKGYMARRGRNGLGT